MDNNLLQCLMFIPPASCKSLIMPESMFFFEDTDQKEHRWHWSTAEPLDLSWEAEPRPKAQHGGLSTRITLTENIMRNSVMQTRIHSKYSEVVGYRR